MSSWQSVVYHSVSFDLSHLNPFVWVFVQPATAKNPERTYRVGIRFSHHCFTEGKKPGDDPMLEYRDSSVKRDHRTFDMRRWALSKRLPDIIASLMTRRIDHGGHENFFTVDLVDEDGNSVEYEVFFEVDRVNGKLYLTVTTAFPRDPAKGGARPRADRIGLATILFNTLNNRLIKPLKR